MRTLVVVSQKGGVGKTTLAGHLGVMAGMNKKALCEIPWVVVFELPAEEVDHVDVVPMLRYPRALRLANWTLLLMPSRMPLLRWDST